MLFYILTFGYFNIIKEIILNSVWGTDFGTDAHYRIIIFTVQILVRNMLIVELLQHKN